MSLYAQKQAPAQRKDNSSAVSVFDASSQSESLQRKAEMANNAAQREEVPRPNNTGMPDNLKSGIESLSGFSMDDVRVHYNSSKPATVQALAYTQGTDIHVAPGQEKYLPHEAWHVAQQMAGRVSPTTNINGMPVNDNAGLEHEADVMGEKAVQCMRNRANASLMHTAALGEFVQRNPDDSQTDTSEIELDGDVYDVEPPSELDDEDESLLEEDDENGEYDAESLSESDDVDVVEIVPLLKLYDEEAKGKFYARNPISEEIEKHNGKPNTLFFQKTEEFYKPDFFGKKYPVYVRRILDLRADGSLGKEHGSSLEDYRRKGKKNDVFGVLKSYKQIIDLVELYTYLGNESSILNIYINSLKEYCLENDIINLIEGALKNEKNLMRIINFSETGDEKKRRISLFLNRLRLMTEYVKNVGERELPNNEKSKKQKKIKDRYFIKSTGSDPHASGQHALFLINRKNGEKKLYKPHSLSFENAFMGNQIGGQQSFLQMLNTFLPSIIKKISFSLMNIDTASQIEEFVERVGDREHCITKDIFNQYMFQLGMLEIAAKVFGIIDLHCENIIFNKQGPVAIDSECGGAFGKNTLIEALDTRAPVTTDESDLVNPSALYVNGEQKQERGFSYELGKMCMSNIIRQNESKIKGKLDEIVSNIDKFRILPIATPELTEILNLYAVNGENYMNELLYEGKECSTFIIERINNYFFEKPKYFGDAVVMIENDLLIDLFDNAIRQGTLPAFEYDMVHGNILLDGYIIGTTSNTFNPKEKMKQCIIEQINAL